MSALSNLASDPDALIGLNDSPFHDVESGRGGVTEHVSPSWNTERPGTDRTPSLPDPTMGARDAVPRGDLDNYAIRGPVGRRPLEMTGAVLSGPLLVSMRAAGPVGQNRRGNVAARATSQLATRIPDESDVVAAFTNPGLSRLVKAVRRGGGDS